MPRYYGFRRLNPYRAVVQVVEVDTGSAHSVDGLTWHLRGDDGYGWVRPTGVWRADTGLQTGAARQPDGLLDAVAARPPLPFPLADRLEAWLLDQADGLPLALLDSALPSRGAHALEARWQGYVLTHLGFYSPALAASGKRLDMPGAHRDYLARLVNERARPAPVLQWFYRHDDGGGTGLAQQPESRERADWRDRVLPAAAFPALLLRTDWNNRLEQSVISDYHDALAARLLPWPRLDDTTRAWLEAATCERPSELLKVHRLLPKVLDPERLRAALVAARLEASAATADEFD